LAWQILGKPKENGKILGKPKEHGGNPWKD
jgi:hypothetical protein